jgi:hypothetical protein
MVQHGADPARGAAMDPLRMSPPTCWNCSAPPFASAQPAMIMQARLPFIGELARQQPRAYDPAGGAGQLDAGETLMMPPLAASYASALPPRPPRNLSATPLQAVAGTLRQSAVHVPSATLTVVVHPLSVVAATTRTICDTRVSRIGHP